MPNTKTAPNLSVLYKEKVIPAMVEKFKYKSAMQVPRIDKVTINMGVGDAAQDKKVVQVAIDTLSAITGQKPVINYAKKSIAGFKIRDGWPIGAKVTLRRDNMYEFLDRLLAIAIPRTRDFRGLSAKSFDGRGNYSMGISEQILFPEIEFDKVDKIRGMDITLTTTAKTDEEALELLRAFAFPLKGKN